MRVDIEILMIFRFIGRPVAPVASFVHIPYVPMVMFTLIKRIAHPLDACYGICVRIGTRIIDMRVAGCIGDETGIINNLIRQRIATHPELISGLCVIVASVLKTAPSELWCEGIKPGIILGFGRNRRFGVYVYLEDI